MTLSWFDAHSASEMGALLADEYASPSRSVDVASALQHLFAVADDRVRDLRLNFYKKAKFANSFKWRLLENGVDKTTADNVTQKLVMHLSTMTNMPSAQPTAASRKTEPPSSTNVRHLLEQGNNRISQGAFIEAITYYQAILRIDPRHAAALNNLGAALSKLGRFREAEGYFQQSIKVAPDFPDPYSNIGTTLLLKGHYPAAEDFLRRALKLNPRFMEARVNLGLVLSFMSRTRDAQKHFKKALKQQPKNPDALVGMALIAKTEGNFDQAATLLGRALWASPGMPKALASQADIRKMSPADDGWRESAEKAARAGINITDESELRFAIGKYYDDIANFKLAFQNYKEGNDLIKPLAEPYDRKAYSGFVDSMIDIYTSEVVNKVMPGASDSAVPVFVVGMPRSGTSLTEQIIASHPAAKGAGELTFWNQAFQQHAATISVGPLGEPDVKHFAVAYLHVLTANSENAIRVVDKAPINADYLGIIHSVFPNARIVYMRRDPIDTCLSCYFQKFALSLNFTMDLTDLAQHYREHARLMSHWRTVLPPNSFLEVPYEELVTDQAGWSRRILEFLGLEWSNQVLDFENTKRSVVTASYWQVRQKVYKTSVRRWRNYEKFIGPLLELKK